MIGTKIIQSGSQSQELDLTPLIDVIFTLIIFLILTMGTSQVMTEIRLSKSQKSMIVGESEQQQILIEIDQKRSLWKIGDVRFSDFNAFSSYFQDHYRNDTQKPVILALEKTLPVEHLITLMDFLSLNGFNKIEIASEWKL